MTSFKQHERRDKAGRIWSTGNAADDAAIRSQIDARYVALHAFGCPFVRYVLQCEADR